MLFSVLNGYFQRFPLLSAFPSQEEKILRSFFISLLTLPARKNAVSLYCSLTGRLSISARFNMC